MKNRERWEIAAKLSYRSPDYELDVRPAKSGRGYTVVQRTTRSGEWTGRWWHWTDIEADGIVAPGTPYTRGVFGIDMDSIGRLLKKGRLND